MKTCKKCLIEKELGMFYKQPAIKGGISYICKQCRAEYTKNLRKKLMLNIDYVVKMRTVSSANFKKGYKSLPVSKEKRKEYLKLYPEKYKVRYMCSKLEKKDKHVLHHWSYNIEHALDVINILRTHHTKIHKHLIYDQNYYMYRRCDTNELLDTKEKHIAFLEICKKDDFNFFIFICDKVIFKSK